MKKLIYMNKNLNVDVIEEIPIAKVLFIFLNPLFTTPIFFNH